MDAERVDVPGPEVAADVRVVTGLLGARAEVLGAVTLAREKALVR